MNKLEMISALKKEADISKFEAAQIVQIFFDSMADSLAAGERIEIRGLCSFFVKKYKSYTGRNPKTGKKSRSNRKSFLSSNAAKSCGNGSTTEHRDQVRHADRSGKTGCSVKIGTYGRKNTQRLHLLRR